MMTKEILTERWGPILYTIGDGGSAGTMQQHMISGAYPGLLNGLMTSLLYEDHWFQVVDSFDCLVLSKLFRAGRRTGRLGRRRQSRCSTRPPCGSSSMARTRPIPTPSARRRSASPPPS